ncbi:trypsin-like serine protease [Streptomyces sp. NPDC005209]|uniref:trypsin-like serine protease n=1 Tax=Streptomyces sp. NPDC005209 TaxID=3156715 RepID=UPI0033B7174B
MGKHRKTLGNGRHRKPAAKGHTGLGSVAAGGLLTAALFVAGASAAQAADSQSTSASDYQSDDSGPSAPDATQYTDQSGDPTSSAADDSQYTDQGYQPDQSNNPADSTTDDSQPAQDVQYDQSTTTTPDSAQPSQDTQSDTQDTLSAAQAADSQSTSTDDIQPTTDAQPNGLDAQPGVWDAQPATDQQPAAEEQATTDTQQPGPDQQPSAGEQSGTDQQRSADTQQPSPDQQTAADAEQPTAQLATDSQPSSSDQQPAPDARQPTAEQPGVSDAQPGTDQQPGADQQPSGGEQSGTDQQRGADHQLNPEAQPTERHQRIAAGDRIRPDTVSPVGGCSVGVPATDGENNFVITAGHCNSGLGSVGEENSNRNGTDPGWFTENGQPVGHTERRGGPGSDFSVVRTETDPNPEDFTEVGEADRGEEVCARGATSFADKKEDKCGVVTDVGKSFTFHNADGSEPTVDDLIFTDGLDTLPGDSGGLLYDKNTHQPLGVLSGGGRFYPLSKVLQQNPDLRLGVAPKSGS